MDPVDEKVLNQIVQLSDFKDCDSSIKSNVIAQVVLGLLMLLLYFCFRRRAPWVYYPNIKNKPQHPCYQETPGFFSWIYPMVTTKDTQLLSMIGLDGFMFLQTIKLLYRICFILFLLLVPFLCGSFYNMKKNEKDMQLFLLLSIRNIKNKNIYFSILFLSYLSTLIIFYLIFIYYKRYVTLRQLYLASPASMTSVSELKRISNELGGNQNAIDYVNISSKTVIIDRLPSEIKNDKQLLIYLNSLKLGEIESVSLIHNTYNLQKMYEIRNGIIQNIEKEVTLALNRAIKLFEYESEKCKESFGELYGGQLEKSSLAIFNQSNFKISEKVVLFNIFCKFGDRFFSISPIGGF